MLLEVDFDKIKMYIINSKSTLKVETQRVMIHRLTDIKQNNKWFNSKEGTKRGKTGESKKI